MRLPAIRGLIDRRILVNYRVDADVLSRILPPPFQPLTVHGFGIAGICLIRLGQVRPRFVPQWIGIGSENAAHRIAVEWERDGEHQTGVFILRRDTSSRLNTLAGGRVFPGLHHHAAFHVRETQSHFEVAVDSADGRASLSVVADLSDRWAPASLFSSVSEASRFFETGSIGYSPTKDGQRFQGLELKCRSWQVEPLAVRSLRSSWFEDPDLFPPGSAELDCALLMRGIQHEWRAQDDLDVDKVSADTGLQLVARFDR